MGARVDLPVGARDLARQLDLAADLLDTELEARRVQVAKYRFRDRTMNVEPVAPFDRAFAVALGERMHEIGMRDIDAHIAEFESLRADILDGRLETPAATAQEAVR